MIKKFSHDYVFSDKGSILTFQSSSTSMREGNIFTANVSVEGKPLPNVTWSYDRTATVILAENTTTISRLNITTTCVDTGNYTLSVDNGLVETDTHNFRINVFCEYKSFQT